MTGHTPAVLAALVGAADDEILDLFGFERSFLHYGLDDLRQQIVGPDLGQHAGVPAEGGAQSVIDIGVEHGALLSQSG
jgi:hypothetical protein